MTYEQAEARRIQLRTITEGYQAAYAALGGGSGARGLTPDAVKFSPAGVAARIALDAAWQVERAHNGFMARHFAKEMREARDRAREVGRLGRALAGLKADEEAAARPCPDLLAFLTDAAASLPTASASELAEIAADVARFQSLPAN